ncbi:RNase adapter RapZ [Sedimenticola thiotaurini]|uniref:GlmZ(SRNA)-inactivating NTPase n=1 Tax=Sedimenticola thiotaurini TaxID=1543721 RepID=A0A0F7K0D5_9GAMM|nr:RNase adapter RapZ [Sedimenticola thiotaurini]AKH20615.1 glmZ(sRNA)-inactivating NTPase [Sedimenticola thiotaurini]
MKLSIITGLSGSGKSVALHTLEDEGYYCIDNLPVFLLPALAGELVKDQDKRFQLVAISIDSRNTPAEFENISTLLHPLKAKKIRYEVIFLEARDETLIKRFSETRRRHPLTGGGRPLAEAISYEREIMAPFLNIANIRIDTSETNLHELRDLIRSRITERLDANISLLFQSFGFKQGIPRDADFIYDARCLPNPHWQPALRPLTGRDSPVQHFLGENSDVQRYKEDLVRFLEQWIPRFEAEGRSYLTIAIGCTGGQHRSVYLVEQLAAHFRTCGRQSQIRHRDLPRVASADSG